MSSSQDRLFVLWHDRKGGFFFPIAQLERRPQSPRYVFRYLASFQEAHEHGLEPLLAFPDVAKVYKSDLLFPFFENRLMRKSRPDYAEYVQSLDLSPESADEMTILGRSGGERATDSFLLMPEPKLFERDRRELYFWASDVMREYPNAWQHVARLEPGTALTVGEHDSLLHEDSVIGRLPEYVRALVPQHVPTQGFPEATPEITVVKKNPQSQRYMLLCRLIFTGGDTTPQLADLGGIPEDPERVGSRKQRPRAVIGKRLPHDLESLVNHLSEGNLPQLPIFERPVSGTLFDKQLSDPEMHLEWLPDQSRLVLSGSSNEQLLELIPVDISRPHETHLELADGSAVYSHTTGSFGMGAKWWCQLNGWTWTGPKDRGGPVHYWVGLLADSSIDFPWMNLGVTTLHSEGLRGFHVNGTPSLTLLQVEELGNSGARQPRLAVIVQASDPEQDIERNLYRATNLLTAVIGISEPPIFFGYDDALTLRVCYSRGRLDGRRDRSWLPVLPLSAEKHRRDLRWPVPFLRCLRDKVFAPPTIDDLHDSLVWFRFVLEESYWQGQFIKMGVMLRLLLRWSMGSSAADWLDPESVSQAMQRFAESRRLNLPKGASDALSLSHRIGVLGDRGIPPFADHEQSFFQAGQLGEVQETLRMTFATLVAGMIGYYGPVVGRLQPIRGFSEKHEPWLELGDLGERECAQQEAEARATYVAGDPDSFPW